MSMIYSLVSRDQVVLTDFTPHSGNFSQVALDVHHPPFRSLPKLTCKKHLDSTPLPTILISFMGYAGAIFGGAIIYLLASFHHKAARIFSITLLILFISSIVFWVRDVLTFIIIICLILLVAVQFKLPNSIYLQRALKVLGLVVLINSLFSPLYLIDGRSRGDGAALAQLTFIPEIVWVILWSSIAIAALYWLAKKSR